MKIIPHRCVTDCVWRTLLRGNRVRYLKESSKVSTVVGSRAPEQLCFSTEGLEKEEKVRIVLGEGDQFRDVRFEKHPRLQT